MDNKQNTNFTNEDLIQTLSDPKLNNLSICFADYKNEARLMLTVRDICKLKTKNLISLQLFASPKRLILQIAIKNNFSKTKTGT